MKAPGVGSVLGCERTRRTDRDDAVAVTVNVTFNVSAPIDICVSVPIDICVSVPIDICVAVTVNALSVNALLACGADVAILAAVGVQDQ